MFTYSCGFVILIPTKQQTKYKVILMALDIFAMATDKEAAVKGVEKEWNGAKVVVARAQNQEYLKYVREQYEKHRAAIEAGNKHSEEVAEHINKEAFCRYILVGWSGFIDKDGKPFPYNLRNAKKVYDAVPDLVRDVTLMSADDENYRIKNLKKDAEDLKK